METHGSPDFDRKTLLESLKEATRKIKQGDFRLGFSGIKSREHEEFAVTLCDLAGFLEQRFHEYDELSRITQNINGGLLLDDMLNHAYESLRHLIPYDRICFALLEQDGALLRVRWVRSESSNVRIKKGYSAPMKDSSLAGIISSGSPRILNDLPQYLIEHPQSEGTKLIVEEGMKSSLTCPLIAHGHPVGFLFFSSMQTNAYREEHVEFFRKIAAQLSLIAEKSYLYEKLVELNEKKNEYLGIAAHDLRSPLFILMEASDLLLSGGAGPVSPEQQRFLRMMHQTSNYMLELVNDCLDVSIIEAGKLELDRKLTELRPLIEHNVDIHRSFARKKNMEIVMQIDPELPSVFLDSRRIEQVLNNLVSNAMKYSDSGTVITVKARVECSHVIVSVEDQGQGIEEKEMKKLFLPFSVTSARSTGGEKSIGLGLVICRKIIEAHGGQIWVRSERQKGAEFSFSLPLPR